MRASAVLLRPARSAGRRFLSSIFARHTVDNDPDFESFRNTLYSDPEYIKFADNEPHPVVLRHVQRFWPLRSSSRRMIPLLAHSSTGNPLGFATPQERRSGTLFDFVCGEKERYPDKVLLVRVGEFYEAFGFDAILLVEHCGLNPMGSKARAGFPIKNIQQTLDGLTNVGLSVVVYEEGGEGTAKGEPGDGEHIPRSGTIKSRFLSQIITPGSSTYIYNSALRTDDIEYREGSSYIGIQISGGGGAVASSVSNTKSGSRADGSLHYTLYDVRLDSRLVRIHERLTEDAARCIIEASSRSKRLEHIYGNRAGQYLGAGTEPEGIEYSDAPDSVRGGGGMFYVARTGGGDIPARTKRVVFGNAGMNGNHVGAMRSGQGSGITRLRRAEKDPQAFLEEFLAHLARDMEAEDVADVTNFRVVGSSDLSAADDIGAVGKQPRPLYAPTAQQLGILPSAQVPDLVSYLLPPSDSPSSARDYLRRWLLRPPPYKIADQMQSLLKGLTSMNHGLPPLRTVVSTGKMVSLVYSKQANANLFRDVAELLESVISILDSTNEDTAGLLSPLTAIVSYECGFTVEPVQLREDTKDALREIDRTVRRQNFVPEADWAPTVEESGCNVSSAAYESLRDMFISGKENGRGAPSGDPSPGFFLDSMFRKNEYDFRSAVIPTASRTLEDYFHKVNVARTELIESIRADLVAPFQNREGQKAGLSPFFSSGNELKYDMLNNKIMFYKKPAAATGQENTAPEWVHPLDRLGRQMPARFTTKSVEVATSNYLGACEDARVAARAELRSLSARFVQKEHLLASVASVQFNETLLAVSLHAREASRKQWEIPALERLYSSAIEENGYGESANNRSRIQLSLPNLVPYWLSAQDGAVENTIELQGQWLLTGSNMSGKSTLLRSVTAAALLANCGLAVPIRRIRAELSDRDIGHKNIDEVPIPRIDGFFLRTNGADCPSEGLSAFALEADDMRILLRDLTPRSIAAVDELGRGTSPQEGAAIVGAILEELDRRGCASIFATHLHAELSRLMDCGSPGETNSLQFHNTTFKAMAVVADDMEHGNVSWTYKLIEGMSKNAHSIATARAHRVPEYVLERATELQKIEGPCTDASSPLVRRGDEAGSAVAECEDSPPIPSSVSIDTVMGALQGTSFYAENEHKLGTTVILDNGWEPPPRMAENVPCVYVLLIEPLGDLYVGETVSLSQRLKQHRSRYGSKLNKIGVIPVEDGNGRSTQRSRTDAKYLETYFINFLQRTGFNLVNVKQE